MMFGFLPFSITTSCSSDDNIALSPLFLRSLFVFIVVYNVAFMLEATCSHIDLNVFHAFLKYLSFSFVSHCLNLRFCLIQTNE